MKVEIKTHIESFANMLWEEEKLMMPYSEVNELILEYLNQKDVIESESPEQIKKEEIIKGLSGEKIEDIQTVTSTEYIPVQPKEIDLKKELIKFLKQLDEDTFYSDESLDIIIDEYLNSK